MNLVLSLLGDELCTDQRFEGNYAECFTDSRVLDVRRREHVIGSDVFSSLDQVNRIARLRVGTLQEHIHFGGVAKNKPARLQDFADAGQVVGSDQNVDIAGRPDQTLIDRRNPSRDRIPPDDRVRNVGLVQQTAHQEKPGLNLFLSVHNSC